ncbi:hypothetical protein Droror1_Dr00013217 [Drosera rotundifolia]
MIHTFSKATLLYVYQDSQVNVYTKHQKLFENSLCFKYICTVKKSTNKLSLRILSNTFEASSSSSTKPQNKTHHNINTTQNTNCSNQQKKRLKSIAEITHV